MWATYLILNFQVATLKSGKKQVKLILITFYLTQEIQYIIMSTCDQYYVLRNLMLVSPWSYFSLFPTMFAVWCRHISMWTWPHFEPSVATCGLWLAWWTAQLPTYCFCPDNSLFQKSVSIDTGGIQRNIMHFLIPEGDSNTIHTCQDFEAGQTRPLTQ